ncbi:MAG: nickel-dependent lactate racemase [Anaerolineae bacterium]|jgi:nickel-dependent lactate racemase|nr:nickel-dependent lactate racemase [Anaerolineae bacterium]
MRVKLAYGKTGLEIDLPDAWDVTVVEPRFVPALPDPAAALAAALRSPIAGPALRDRVRATDRVGLIFSDITRPTPHHLILPAVLAELAHVPRENVTLFNALGTHRPNTPDELRGMIGGLLDGYRLVQNDAFDPETQVRIGVTARGHEVWINREAAACDVKVLTGFIEPHFFAGFSGGGKALMPGMAGQRTVLGNHDAGMIANPNATWGVTEGNPIWEEVMEVAELVGGAFLCNVTLNRDKAITGVFAGDLRPAHAAGCAFAKDTAMAAVDEPFDIVITTNSGYPLDLNLYQAVKGMSAAAQVVKPGDGATRGVIICAADCWDGIPDHGLYGQLLADADSPRQLLDTITAPGFLKQDQWQAQIQAQLQLKADIYVRTGNLSDEQLRRALLEPCHDITGLVGELREKLGPTARICVLPEGPQTIPYLRAA